MRHMILMCMFGRITRTVHAALIPEALMRQAIRLQTAYDVGGELEAGLVCFSSI